MKCMEKSRLRDYVLKGAVAGAALATYFSSADAAYAQESTRHQEGNRQEVSVLDKGYEKRIEPTAPEQATPLQYKEEKAYPEGSIGERYGGRSALTDTQKVDAITKGLIGLLVQESINLPKTIGDALRGKNK